MLGEGAFGGVEMEAEAEAEAEIWHVLLRP